MNGNPEFQSPIVSYFRGRLVRDAHIGDRKDNSGDKFVMGRLRCSINIVDQHGENRTIDRYVEMTVFRRDDANAIASVQPKAGALLEVAGNVVIERGEYTDKETGEVKQTLDLRCMVSEDNPEYFARLV